NRNGPLHNLVIRADDQHVLGALQLLNCQRWDENRVRSLFGSDAHARELTRTKPVGGVRKRSPDFDSACLGIYGSINYREATFLVVHAVVCEQQLKRCASS